MVPSAITLTTILFLSGVAVTDFDSGTGRVKIGDTEWSAELVEGAGPVKSGDSIIVDASRSTTVLIRPAG